MSWLERHEKKFTWKCSFGYILGLRKFPRNRQRKTAESTVNYYVNINMQKRRKTNSALSVPATLMYVPYDHFSFECARENQGFRLQTFANVVSCYAMLTYSADGFITYYKLCAFRFRVCNVTLLHKCAARCHKNVHFALDAFTSSVW